jgi:hypothetical protein
MDPAEHFIKELQDEQLSVRINAVARLPLIVTVLIGQKDGPKKITALLCNIGINFILVKLSHKKPQRCS